MNAYTPGLTSDESELLNSASAEAIHEFLDILEDTESPREFLTWSLIATAAALIGKNAKLRTGPMMSVSANLFVILLGPAGVRKSTAINLAKDFIEGRTLNYGPTDTGGQRHGIMSALSGARRFNPRPIWATSHDKIPPLMSMQVSTRPPNDMAFYESELGRLMGTGSNDMADFFVDLWDGEAIDYQTKAGETVIREPLVTLLSATTPSNLAKILPDNAAGHGILSRMLFIYSDRKHKDVPIPPEQPPEWYERKAQFEERLAWIDRNRFDFSLDPRARDLYTALYPFIPDLGDPRLEHYKERRPRMLLKVGMALAALRNDPHIIESDIALAHTLLVLAEPSMSRSLEYFGRNRAFQGRMIIVQYLRTRGGPASKQDLVNAAAAELSEREALEAISAMLASKELVPFGQNGLILGSMKNELIDVKIQRNRNQ